MKVDQFLVSAIATVELLDERGTPRDEVEPANVIPETGTVRRSRKISA